MLILSPQVGAPVRVDPVAIHARAHAVMDEFSARMGVRFVEVRLLPLSL